MVRVAVKSGPTPGRYMKAGAMQHLGIPIDLDILGTLNELGHYKLKLIAKVDTQYGVYVV